MSKKQLKEKAIFFLSVLVAGFLVWFGFRFIFLSSSSISSTQHFIVGSIFVFVGIAILSNPNIAKRWLYGGAAIAVGFFDLARAAELIDYPWVARLIGLASWGAATMIVYISYPKSKEKIIDKHE